MAAIAALALHGTRARNGLHVIVHQCQKGVEVAPVEGVNGSVMQFHVLLRHRLLREADGFEGFRRSRVVPHLVHLPAKVPTWGRVFAVAPLPRVVRMTKTMTPFARVADFEFERRFGQRARPPRNEMLLGSTETSSSGCGIAERVLDSGCTVDWSSLRSLRLNAAWTLTHDLHVLLRHRPRSIPQAQESA